MSNVVKNIFAGIGIVATALIAFVLISTLDTGDFTSVGTKR